MNNALKAFAAAAVQLLLVGCVPSVTLTRTGPPLAAKPANCEFTVLTTAPAGDYAEIGTLDAAGTTSTLSTFKAMIAPRVCEAGGDAVIAQANGYGIYLKATILKSEPARASAPPAAPTLTQASVPAPHAVGCTFDTQCKGDRVCTKGECVEPKTSVEPKAKRR